MINVSYLQSDKVGECLEGMVQIRQTADDRDRSFRGQRVQILLTVHPRQNHIAETRENSVIRETKHSCKGHVIELYISSTTIFNKYSFH